MSRLMIVSICAAWLLAGCGQIITITLPGAQPGAALPTGYEQLFSPAPHAFRRSLPGEPVRLGKTSERFELREGDCGGSDCENARYRTEIKEENRVVEARLGQDIWYGWSFYNANIAAVTRDRSLGTVIGQWKPEGEQPPVFRIAQTVPGATGAAQSPGLTRQRGMPTASRRQQLSGLLLQ